jgi:hypothetical protein
MFAQPMSRTNATAPVSMRSTVFIGPTLASRSGTAQKSSQCPMDSGNFRANGDDVFDSCCAARCTVTCGYSFPTTRIVLAKSMLNGFA